MPQPEVSVPRTERAVARVQETAPVSSHEDNSVVRYFAEKYDDLMARIDQGDSWDGDHDDHGIAIHYRWLASESEELIKDIERNPNVGPSPIFPTRHDGPLDRAALFARLRAEQAKAEKVRDTYQERWHKQLYARLHVVSEEQRKVLDDYGTSLDVVQQRGHTCWVYVDNHIRNTFCWTGAGKLAERTRVDEMESKRGNTRYYGAAMFAAGSCRGKCGTGGWVSKLPSGKAAISSCESSDCLRYGWTTTYPEGKAVTRCGFKGCAASGWSTSYPDRIKGTASCRSDDCAGKGYSVRLSTGETVSCSCYGGGGCGTYGSASCSFR